MFSVFSTELKQLLEQKKRLQLLNCISSGVCIFLDRLIAGCLMLTYDTDILKGKEKKQWFYIFQFSFNVTINHAIHFWTENFFTVVLFCSVQQAMFLYHYYYYNTIFFCFPDLQHILYVTYVWLNCDSFLHLLVFCSPACVSYVTVC